MAAYKYIFSTVPLWRLNHKIKTDDGEYIIFDHLDGMVYGYIARATYGGIWFNFIMKNAIHDLYTSEKEITWSLIKLGKAGLLKQKNADEDLPNLHLRVTKSCFELEEMIKQAAQEQVISTRIIPMPEEYTKTFKDDLARIKKESKKSQDDDDCPF